MISVGKALLTATKVWPLNCISQMRCRHWSTVSQQSIGRAQRTVRVLLMLNLMADLSTELAT